MYLSFYLAFGVNEFDAGRSITWALEGVGPENRDFLGPEMLTSEAIAIWAPKKSRCVCNILFLQKSNIYFGKRCVRSTHPSRYLLPTGYINGREFFSAKCCCCWYFALFSCYSSETSVTVCIDNNGSKIKIWTVLHLQKFNEFSVVQCKLASGKNCYKVVFCIKL
jgi:hypothetical protein